MKDMRYKIRILNQQYNRFVKVETTLYDNLIELLEQTYPGVNALFGDPEEDKDKKWIKFVTSFWHVKIVADKEAEEFRKKFRAWCEKHALPFDQAEADRIFADAKNKKAHLPKDEISKSMARDAVVQYNSTAKIVSQQRKDLIALTRQLPEYDIVMSIVGRETFPAVQVIAEIGDVRRFPKIDSLISFARVHVGKRNAENVQEDKTSKTLKKALTDLIEIVLKEENRANPVYAHMKAMFNEKQPYYTITQAGIHKFLSLYYGKVKECLNVWDPRQ